MTSRHWPGTPRWKVRSDTSGFDHTPRREPAKPQRARGSHLVTIAATGGCRATCGPWSRPSICRPDVPGGQSLGHCIAEAVFCAPAPLSERLFGTAMDRGELCDGDVEHACEEDEAGSSTVQATGGDGAGDEFRQPL